VLTACLLFATKGLAYVITLDQFTRNVFRGDPKSFQFDSIAREVTLQMIDAGDLSLLRPLEQAFLLMPLEHSEDIKVLYFHVQNAHVEQIPS
jgi:uncharacterized protein (DUF924 family)